MLPFALLVVESVVIWVLSTAVMVPLALVFSVVRIVDGWKRITGGRVRVNGAVFVVTGAASGFGKCVTEMLTADGAIVYALDLKLDSLKEAFKGNGNVRLVQCDVTKQADVTACANRIAGDRVKVFALLNNAGIAPLPGASVESTEYEHVMDVNFFGATRMARALWPHMLRSATKNAADQSPVRGRVVNISSMAGLTTGKGMAAYYASKFALNAFSDVMRQETAAMTDVICVCPFFARTNIYTQGFAYPEEKMEGSIVRDDFLRTKSKLQEALASNKVMSCEYVSGEIVKSLTQVHPKNYVDLGPVPVRVVLRLFMHAPNYLNLIDKARAVMKA